MLKINQVALSTVILWKKQFPNQLKSPISLTEQVSSEIFFSLQLLETGAIAGVYSMVDSTRGVWKAPANVSLA